MHCCIKGLNEASSKARTEYGYPRTLQEGGKYIFEEKTGFTNGTVYEWQVINTRLTKSIKIENTGLLRDVETFQVVNAMTYDKELVEVLVTRTAWRNRIKGGCNY
jgi:hypothetical protein